MYMSSANFTKVITVKFRAIFLREFSFENTSLSTFSCESKFFIYSDFTKLCRSLIVLLKTGFALKQANNVIE